jgi:hypothetical protein
LGPGSVQGLYLAVVNLEVVDVSAGHSVLMPASCWSWRRKSSSLKVNMPQSVWWISMISSVPGNRCEIDPPRDGST